MYIRRLFSELRIINQFYFSYFFSIENRLVCQKRSRSRSKFATFIIFRFTFFFLALKRNEELREKIEFVMSNYTQFE